jgi:hypothetical protein
MNNKYNQVPEALTKWTPKQEAFTIPTGNVRSKASNSRTVIEADSQTIGNLSDMLDQMREPNFLDEFNNSRTVKAINTLKEIDLTMLSITITSMYSLYLRKQK